MLLVCLLLCLSLAGHSTGYNYGGALFLQTKQDENVRAVDLESIWNEIEANLQKDDDDQEDGPVQYVQDDGPVRYVQENGPVQYVQEDGQVRYVQENGPVQDVQEVGPVRYVQENGPIQDVQEVGQVQEIPILIRQVG